MAGLRTSRAAVESLMREFIRSRSSDKPECGDGQFERIRDSALVISRKGDPFYPGFRRRSDNGADAGNGQAADNGRSAIDNGKAAGNGAAESEAEIRARVARQHERIFKSAMAIAREGSPFRPDYDYKAQRRRDARRFAAKMRKLGWERE